MKVGAPSGDRGFRVFGAPRAWTEEMYAKIIARLATEGAKIQGISSATPIVTLIKTKYGTPAPPKVFLPLEAEGLFLTHFSLPVTVTYAQGKLQVALTFRRRSFRNRGELASLEDLVRGGLAFEPEGEPPGDGDALQSAS